VYPGQKIEVRSPDGSRLVDTVVPDGLYPGQAFLVKFPPLTQPQRMQLQGTSARDGAPLDAPEESRQQDYRHLDASKEANNEQVPEKPKYSFAKSLEKFLTPKPDPDIIKAAIKTAKIIAEKEKKDREEKAIEEAATDTTEPDIRSQMAVANPNSYATQSLAPSYTGYVRQPHSALSQHNEVNTAGRPLHSNHHVQSAMIRKVQGSLLDATITHVPVEKIQAVRQETFSNKEVSKPKDSYVAEEKNHNLTESTSLVKSTEELFTPTPDDAPPKPEKTPRPQSSSRPRPSHEVQKPRHQKLIHVQVPIGMLPGSTIYVEIPGEDRTVAAQVPPGVTSFHVAYTPRAPVIKTAAPTQALGESVARPGPQAGKEKLLSVRVPVGTPPGTTLHISVPGEPGRILAAQVPPGNVEKFHVSYMPSGGISHCGAGMLPPANAYRGSQPGLPTALHGALQQPYNTQHNGFFVPYPSANTSITTHGDGNGSHW
jgi:hypothetical protein